MVLSMQRIQATRRKIQGIYPRSLSCFLFFFFQISNFEKLVPEETKSTSDGLDFQSQSFTQTMSPLPHKNELMSTNEGV